VLSAAHRAAAPAECKTEKETFHGA